MVWSNRRIVQVHSGVRGDDGLDEMAVCKNNYSGQSQLITDDNI